jgi:hypothetical protein
MQRIGAHLLDFGLLGRSITFKAPASGFRTVGRLCHTAPLLPCTCEIPQYIALTLPSCIAPPWILDSFQSQCLPASLILMRGMFLTAKHLLSCRELHMHTGQVRSSEKSSGKPCEFSMATSMGSRTPTTNPGSARLVRPSSCFLTPSRRRCSRQVQEKQHTF